MRCAFGYAAITALSASVAYAAGPTCGPNSPCPESAPCCSQYGQCGVGAYCLGGCDPLFSHSLDSCVPAPACSSQDYKLTGLDGIVADTDYLGDPSTANWVSSGQPVAYDNSVLLTMAPSTVGTLLTSTKYVWYGKVCATLTTSQGAGVVTAFILMSDVKDEIDFEFIGVDTEHTQSNFYWQGVDDYNNELNLSASSTQSQVHTYCFDWQPDTLTWSVDGNNMRTLNKADTWNTTDNVFHYPQTPARIELSLWPAGLSSNGQGTVDWSGGLVNWNSPYMKNGYYYAMFSDVNVQCYDPPSGYNNSGTKSYVYTNNNGLNTSVSTTNELDILGSFYATGENPSFGAQPSGSGSSTASAPTPSNSNVQTVPGSDGAGSRGASGGSQGGSSGGSNSGSGSGSSGTSSAPGSGSTSFSQGTGGSSTSEANIVKTWRTEGGSAFAVVIAMLGLLLL
ncbi:glycoside hydrolase family 16 protein [Viridothelium virens]|uniref:Glycoside hydrolase family 16 protein n=1 Tax=Viridothelium virens TaxID=1048519 RepID=A0A6A6HH80_VIRVR|nr:glycoside hydrolase family 16 protein [Viridothelium virens]